MTKPISYTVNLPFLICEENMFGKIIGIPCHIWYKYFIKNELW